MVVYTSLKKHAFAVLKCQKNGPSDQSKMTQDQSWPQGAHVWKTVIGGAPDGYWYSVHAIDGSGSLRWDNVERRICRCDSSTSGSGVEVIAPKSEALHASLALLPIADTSAECRWRKEECGGTIGLEFESLLLKIAVK